MRKHKKGELIIRKIYKNVREDASKKKVPCGKV